MLYSYTILRTDLKFSLFNKLHFSFTYGLLIFVKVILYSIE